MEIKVSGKLILVFPSGTRYRPWDPASKRGVREIDSYIKAFDYMCPVAINGEVLHVHQGDMMEDPVSKDLVLLTAGPVRSCAAFRDQCRAEAEAAGIADKKQAVADALMGLLEEMHLQAEEERQKLKAGPLGADPRFDGLPGGGVAGVEGPQGGADNLKGLERGGLPLR